MTKPSQFNKPALVSREIASKINPLIGTTDNGNIDTLNQCSVLIRDLGYVVSICSEHTDADIFTNLYLITGVVSSALDYEAESLRRRDSHENA